MSTGTSTNGGKPTAHPFGAPPGPAPVPTETTFQRTQREKSESIALEVERAKAKDELAALVREYLWALPLAAQDKAAVMLSRAGVSLDVPGRVRPELQLVDGNGSLLSPEDSAEIRGSAQPRKIDLTEIPENGNAGAVKSLTAEELAALADSVTGGTRTGNPA